MSHFSNDFDQPRNQIRTIDVLMGFVEYNQLIETLAMMLCIAKELQPLEDGFETVSRAWLAGLYLKLVGPAFYLGLANYGYDLLNMFGFYLANAFGRVEEQSSFGLMVFFCSLFIHGLYYSIDEKIGVATALAFGAKDYRRVNVILWQGLLTITFAIVFVFAPTVYWSQSIFLAVGMTPVNAAMASRMLKFTSGLL